MIYEDRKAQTSRDQEYLNLQIRKITIQDQVSAWIAAATTLHTNSPLQTDKDDLLAMKAEMIANLSATLGV